jgi:hypothetical protein
VSSAILVYRKHGRFDDDLNRYLDGPYLAGYVWDGLVYKDQDDSPISIGVGEFGGGTFVGSVTEDGRLFRAPKDSDPCRGVGKEIGRVSDSSAYHGSSSDRAWELRGPEGKKQTVYRMVDEETHFQAVEWGWVDGIWPYSPHGGTSLEAIGAVLLINMA